MASEDIFEEYSEEIITQLDNEFVNEIEEPELSGTNEIQTVASEEIITGSKSNVSSAGKRDETTETESDKNCRKLFQLPMARIKNLMKLDPDLNIVSNEAVFVTTRATELFIESLAREAFLHTSQAKKKIIQKRDVDYAISEVDSLMFLDGAMNF